MHTLFLALRYLKKRRLAFFGIGAVMLCVALLIVVTSLFTGFINSFQEHSRRLWGDIIVMPAQAMSTADYLRLADAFENLPEISAATATATTGGLLYLRPGEVRAVEIMGIDLSRRGREDYFRRGLLLQGQEGSAIPSFALSATAQTAALQAVRRDDRPVRETDLPVGAVLGVGLMAQPDDLTDEYPRAELVRQMQHWEKPLIITTGRKPEKLADDQASAIKRRLVCWPVDALETGLHQADTQFVYLPLEQVCRLLGRPDPDGTYRCVARMQVDVAPGVNVDQAIDKVHQAYRQLAQANPRWPRNVTILASAQLDQVRMLTHEIGKQLRIWQLMLGLTALVVAFLVFVTLYMMVMQKKRDIGIVRSVGSSRSGIAVIFLAYGVAIGMTGAVLGVVLGITATRHINGIESFLTHLLGFKIWKSGVYMFKHIPSSVAWDAVFWIVLVGVAAALLGAVVPALRAARLQPVEALRFE